MAGSFFLNENLEILRKYNPYTFKWLTSHPVDRIAVENNVIENRYGLPDWCISPGKGLFDDIPPDKAYKWWTSGKIADASVTIIVGCNLGYGVNRMLADMPINHKVIVLEPRCEMLLACLGQTDYRGFLRTKRLFFFPPDREFLREAVDHLDLHYVFGKIRVLADWPSYQLGPEYASLTEELKEILENIACDITTIRQKQDVMIKNELKNFVRAEQDGCLLPLKERANGVHAVVLGAGPSLKKFAPLLAENPGNALYACGLQVLPALQKYGLKPHLCMAIDYTKNMERVYEKLDRTWAQDIPFIYSCKVRPEVVEAYPGPSLPLWTNGGIGSNIPRSRELVLNTGKGVGTTLIRFLLWCGVRSFLLVGHDFAWRGSRVHVEGHLSDKNRFEFDPKCHKKLKNRESETIYSTLAYITAMRELERELDRPDVSAFNLYGGGAVIKGVKEVDWKQVVDDRMLEPSESPLRCFLAAIHQARRPKPWPVLEARGVQWKRSLLFVEKKLKRLFRKAASHQQEIYNVLNQILVFLRQDPLYQPCLYNEIFDLAGLVHARSAYGLKEWAECKVILKQVIKKVREVDYYLVYKQRAA